MSDIWNGFRDLFVQALDLLHGLFAFVGDEPAWGFAIIALTLIVRVLLLPLAIKQTRSMRAMQELQPQIKAIQKKYKVDRELLKKDPEQYKAKRQKMNEEMQALYQESGVNPAGGCLPLIAQAPIFIALFSVLRTSPDSVEPNSVLGQLVNADFYFLTPDATGLSTGASDAGIVGIVLILLMAASMFYSQRQMMARNAANADPAQKQQQRIMMIVMPVFLAFISFGFPMGVLLYWVTTNVWQIGQQAIILREVEHDSPTSNGGSGSSGGGKGPSGGTPKRGGGTSGSPADNGKKNRPAGKKPSGGSGTPKKPGGGGRAGNKDHLPSRPSRRNRK